MDQLTQNLARVHNLVHSFDTNHKIFNFTILPIVSIVFYCSSIDHLCPNFDAQDFTSLIQNYKLKAISLL